jgi:hypothetical protein
MSFSISVVWFRNLYESQIYTALKTHSSVIYYIEDPLKFDSNLARNRKAGKLFKMLSLYPFSQIYLSIGAFKWDIFPLNIARQLELSVCCLRVEQCHSVLITADGRWAMYVVLTRPLPPSWSMLKGFQTTTGNLLQVLLMRNNSQRCVLQLMNNIFRIARGL